MHYFSDGKCLQGTAIYGAKGHGKLAVDLCCHPSLSNSFLSVSSTSSTQVPRSPTERAAVSTDFRPYRLRAGQW